MQKQTKSQGTNGKKGVSFWVYAGFMPLLCACTTDPVPDENFELPTMSYPLLGHVPDRPRFESSACFIHRQKRLQHEHDEAVKERGKVVESLNF